MPVEQEVRKGEDGRYQCPHCNKRVGNLKRHIQGVHEDQRPFTCEFPGCKSKPFKQKDNLQSHIKSVHEGKKPFKCNFPKCGWAFPRKEGLERHARIKHGLNPILCTDCGKNCATRYAHSLHWNIKHANTPPWAHERFHTHYRCPIRFCKKFFKTAEEALAHVRGPDHGHEDDFTQDDLQDLHNPVDSPQDASVSVKRKGNLTEQSLEGYPKSKRARLSSNL